MILQEVFEPIIDDPVAFIIKGSPDPDAIASSLALLAYYESLGGSGKILYNAYVSHSNNKAMINVLGIQMEKITPDSFADLKNKYKHYVVVDHSSFSVEGFDPSACLLHIDHHKEALEEKKKKKTSSTEDAEVENYPHQIIELDAGACSSIVTRLLKEEGFFEKNSRDLERVATSLVYGVRSDTDNLDNAGPKDYEAMQILSKHCSRADVKKITQTRITSQTAHVLKKAYEVMKEESSWLYAGVGFLQENYRDSIATVADEMMRHAGIEHTLIYAIIEREDGSSVVEGSVRSIDTGMDLDGFARAFSDNAGGRKHKAGFQIPLSFWGTCSNRELLSSFVTETVEEKFRSILSAEK